MNLMADLENAPSNMFWCYKQCVAKWVNFFPELILAENQIIYIITSNVLNELGCFEVEFPLQSQSQIVNSSQNQAGKIKCEDILHMESSYSIV